MAPRDLLSAMRCMKITLLSVAMILPHVRSCGNDGGSWGLLHFHLLVGGFEVKEQSILKSDLLVLEARTEQNVSKLS
jgi:hypothetical protein